MRAIRSSWFMGCCLRWQTPGPITGAWSGRLVHSDTRCKQNLKRQLAQYCIIYGNFSSFSCTRSPSRRPVRSSTSGSRASSSSPAFNASPEDPVLLLRAQGLGRLSGRSCRRIPQLRSVERIGGLVEGHPVSDDRLDGGDVSVLQRRALQRPEAQVGVVHQDLPRRHVRRAMAFLC